MKNTVVLLRHHIGWHFSKNWRVRGKKKPIDMGADKWLIEKGIPIYKPKDFLHTKQEFKRFDIIGYKDKPVPRDKNHPNWHSEPLLSYRDNNVLLEGLSQAKILTKSVEIEKNKLSNVDLNDTTEEVNKRVRNIIMESFVYDAEQKKLPKIKDPERPAWNFPRSYGITQKRSNKLVISRLIQLIESVVDENLIKDRYIFNDLSFSFPFIKYGNLIQFELSGDIVIMSSKPLSVLTMEPTETLALPDISPIKPTITLNEDNIYEISKMYPIKPYVAKSCPHTIFIYYDKEEVKNIYEEEVTESQIFGRSLLKSFTAAACYARWKYGEDVKLLPKPVTIQCVQTDGRFYHFGAFQLNTLDLDNDESKTKNVWYQMPLLNLFNSCSYKIGQPCLDGYNSEVVKHLCAFYNNV